MVGIADAACGKTLVRSHHGIRGAFVVEKASEGKSIVEVQLEGSCFETVWQLKEGSDGGILDLNKVDISYCPVSCNAVLVLTDRVVRFLISRLTTPRGK